MSGRRFIIVVLAGLLGLLSLGGVAAGAGLLPRDAEEGVATEDSGRSGSADGPLALILELQGKPSGVVSDSRAEGQADANAELQDAVADDAASEGLIDSELFRVGVAYNGVAVMADPGEAQELAKLDGVKAVHELPEHEPTNSESVPYIGGDQAWSAAGGDLTGEGIKIGIIDSGIDYAHVDFGGPGSDAAYTEANSAAANPAATSEHNPAFEVAVGGDAIYPSAKVVGGFDFVGSAYNGGTVTTPSPDPNPIDCAADDDGGHGTHVAGSAGGYGVKADGETFDGDYSTLDPSGMRIGPGVAPEAELYALKVFGCGGSTSFTLAAVDWAMDPDRDGSTTDHLDVINLSLGSSFGMPDDPTAKGLSNAAEAGVSVVSSAGNSGNTTNISGSPASSPRTITVANMSTGSHLDGIGVGGATDPGTNGTRDALLSVNFPWEDFDTPVSAPLAWADQTGCAPLAPGTYGGKIAMLRWTTGECGSLARANAAEAAGALGVVLLVDSSTYDLSFAGNATLPLAYVINPVRNQLIDAADDGATTITFDKALNGQGYTTAGAGTLNDSSSRGPGAGGAPKPDISAPGSNIRSAKSGTGDYHVDYTGTSMAAPHVAGAMALLREAKPSWSVEDLKAAAMNTASSDVTVGAGLAGAGGNYPPQRVGTGVLDVPAALETELVAKASPGSGEVGLGFGQLQAPLGSPFQREETVTIVNHGGAAEVVDASFIPRSAPPGVVFSVPDGTDVSVPAGGSATVTVRISIPDPSALRNARDATLATTQTGFSGTVFNRLFDVDASGLLTLTPESSAPPLLVPVHANVRPASAMEAEDDVLLAPDDTSGEVEVSGQTIDTGNGASDWEAAVSAFELAARSPQGSLAPGTPEYARFADIRSVGVAEDSGFLMFGIGTDAPLPAPSTYGTFEVSIDTDEDGDDEFVIYNRRWTNADTFGIDVFGTGYFNVATSSSFIRNPLLSGSFPGTGEFGSRALVIPIPLATLGLSGGNLDFDYTVRSYANRLDEEIDSVGPLSWDAANPGISFDSGSYYRPDVAGPIDFDYDVAAATENSAEGILLLHHLNVGADQAEIVDVEAPPVVRAGGPYSGNEGSTVTLDASGSADPNGDPLTIAWDLDDDGSYETSGASTPFALGDGPATRTVGLRVADGNSPPVERDVSVAVANVAPTATISALGDPATGVRVGASDASGADSAAGFEFRVDVGADGSIEQTISGASPRDVQLALPAGTTTISVSATDKDGAVSSPEQISVTKEAAVRCVVPKLKGESEKAARKALEAAGCTLGKVKKPKGKKAKGKGKLVVSKQSVSPGTELTEDSSVGITLKKKKKGRGKK